MKKTLDIKKLILLNMPYILLGLFATNFGEAWRMAQGADASEKFLSLVAVLPGALQSFWPSLHPLDLLVGLCCGVGLRLAVYIAQVGDTLKIEGRAFDGRTFDVEAVVVGTYNRSDLMEDSPVVPGSPYFIMTYDTAKKLTGITEQTGILAIKNSEGCFDEVLTAVQKIADKNEKIEVNTIEQTIKNIQHRYSASINALYMTSAILFVFGSISLMNMLMVDFQNRKREFGLLEAVGVTRKQLKAMLNREIGIYLGGSLAISLICGSIFSVIVCRRLDAINHCITLKLPWFFLLALICVLLVIYLVFSMYSKMELKKASILSAIKSE